MSYKFRIFDDVFLGALTLSLAMKTYASACCKLRLGLYNGCIERNVKHHRSCDSNDKYLLFKRTVGLKVAIDWGSRSIRIFDVILAAVPMSSFEQSISRANNNSNRTKAAIDEITHEIPRICTKKKRALFIFNSSLFINRRRHPPQLLTLSIYIYLRYLLFAGVHLLFRKKIGQINEKKNEMKSCAYEKSTLTWRVCSNLLQRPSGCCTTEGRSGYAPEAM